MELIFIAVVFTGLIYFLFAKREFDLYSIGYFSACVYFMPGYFGYVLYPSKSELVPFEIIPETYLVMTAVLCTILMFAIAFDLLARRHRPKICFHGGEHTAFLAILLAIAGLGLSIVTTGEIFLIADKIEIMENLNRWYILATMSSSVAAVISFQRKRWRVLAVSMLFLLIVVYVGFRAPFAITIMTLFILWISRDSKPHRLITSKFNACILALISGFAVFAYKGLYIAVKRGDIDLIISNVVNPKYYLSTIESSEPFITQAILNEVLRQSFVIGIDHLKSLFYQLVLFAPDLGYNIVSFNDIFQPALFPESGWMGMANNIWGEAISSGGWPLLIMFAIIYSLLLGVGSYLLRSHDPEIKAGMALIFSWWAFYINRNDLFNQISFEKRIVLLWMGCVVGSMFINLLAERLKKTISVSGPV